jgi:phosphatidylethanolamine-binding protein (PEBP) family uncharacterized protein
MAPIQVWWPAMNRHVISRTIFLGLSLALAACSSSSTSSPDARRAVDGAAGADGSSDGAGGPSLDAGAADVMSSGSEAGTIDGAGDTTPADAALDAAADAAPDAGVADAPPTATDAAIDASPMPADASPVDGAPEPSDGAASDTAASAFIVTAPWADDATIDPMYTCAAGQHFPAISWTPGPAGTMSYALVFFDTANSLVHLAITDIPPTVHSLPPVPAGAHFGPESSATGSTWPGPCPMGNEHLYRLTIYALGTATYNGPMVTDTDLRINLDDHDNAAVLARAVVTGRSSAEEP